MSKLLAATFGMDVAEIRDYRYQPGKYKKAIYAIGNDYFCVSRTKPKEPEGIIWSKHNDQFFTEPKNTVLWKGV